MRSRYIHKLLFGIIALVAILPVCEGSMLYSQPQSGYISVRDPRENAFSVEVPKGWKTIGGMFRYGYVDARPLIDTTSPDGLTNVRIGDATIPPYTSPGPLNMRRGPGVAPYATGEQFAQRYGQARFASMCQSVQLKGSRAMPAKYHPSSAQGEAYGLVTTGGEAYFSCTRNGREMFGYVYSETFRVGFNPANANWYVVALGSMISPTEQGKATGEILKHAADSIRYNPDWVRMQQQHVDTATQVLLGQARATAQANQQMNQHQQQVMNAQQQQNDNFNDILNGVSYTRDTVTGQTYEVPMGTGGQQWVNGNRVVVESGMSPGPGFHPLQNISR